MIPAEKGSALRFSWLLMAISASMRPFLNLDISASFITNFSSLSLSSPKYSHDRSYCWAPVASLYLRSLSSSVLRMATSDPKGVDDPCLETSANSSFSLMFVYIHSSISSERSWALTCATLTSVSRCCIACWLEPWPMAIGPS